MTPQVELLTQHSDRLIALDLVVRALIRSHPVPQRLVELLEDGLSEFRLEYSVWDPGSDLGHQSARVDDLCREYLELLPEGRHGS